jgi:hypothetical protein
MKFIKLLSVLFLIALLIPLFYACTSNNPDPTGTFNATFTGDFDKFIEGDARFSLQPSGINGKVFIHLRESDIADVYLRLIFPNPSSTQIVLEPGTYTIVPQLGNDITSEVLVDFFNGGLSFTAQSGQINIGISKTTQISGQIVNAEFSILKSMCNGTFDAIPN